MRIIKRVNVVGRPATGKSTVIRELVLRHPNSKWSPRVTSRDPRNGDLDGDEYNYTGTNKRFLELVKSGEILRRTVKRRRDTLVDPPRIRLRGIWSPEKKPEVYFPNDPAVEILFSSWGPTHSLWLTETYPELSDTIHIFLTGNKWLLLGRLINRHGALTRGPAQSGEVSVHWKTIEEFQVNKIQEDYEKDHHVIDTTEIIGSKYITIKEVVRKVEEIAGLPSPD